MIRTLLVVFTISAGLSLAALNFYGLTQSLRPEGLTADVLRFEENDLLLDKESFKKGVERKHHENDKDYDPSIMREFESLRDYLVWNVFNLQQNFPFPIFPSIDPKDIKNPKIEDIDKDSEGS